MIESKKKWMIERPDETVVGNLMEALQISSVHAKILAARGIITPDLAKDFLHMDESAIHDPFLLIDMEKAVQILTTAIENNEKIAVYGDYDADGVTSTALLVTALEQLGADVFFVIPNRFTHGYGPNIDLFKEIAEKGASVLVTVDNGVSGVDEIAYAKSLGMQVIITDHHEFGETLPNADAIIHPRHPDGNYPFGDLAGVGVAFKLASALLDETPVELLELVAIGTVADLVPLHGENRYFVKKGIQIMRRSKRPAIQALAKNSGVEISALNEESIGFMIGPRLNAAGRLGDATPAVDLLMATDSTLASSIADELDAMNKERQQIVTTIANEAEALIQEEYGEEIPHVLVLAKEGWNAGVVGIVASRLTDKYYRPTILLSIDPETGIAKGSARSIEGYNMYKELTKNNSYLQHYGGHPMAAGMSLEAEKISDFRNQLNSQAREILTEDKLIPTLRIDVPLTIDEIDVSILESFEILRPFGMGFEKPTFIFENIQTKSIRKIGAAQNHLKLELEHNGQLLDCIGFSHGHRADHLTEGVRLSVVGDLQINEWNGNKKPQLLLQDIYSSEWQLFDLRGIREPRRWRTSIPMEQATFIAFQEQTAVHFKSELQDVSIVHYSTEQSLTSQYIVLLDLPNEADTLKTMIQQNKPNRIYAHFHVAESIYFEGIPGREQFAWYYSFLKKRGKFNMKQDAEKLIRHKGWKKDSVSFMSQVFSELGFVKIENGLVTIEEDVEKRELSEAPTFRVREKQMELEKKLLYTPYEELKKWFELIRNGTLEEEAN